MNPNDTKETVMSSALNPEDPPLLAWRGPRRSRVGCRDRRHDRVRVRRLVLHRASAMNPLRRSIRPDMAQRLERAEAALTRVAALADEWASGKSGGLLPIRLIREALKEPEVQT